MSLPCNTVRVINEKLSELRMGGGKGGEGNKKNRRRLRRYCYAKQLF